MCVYNKKACMYIYVCVRDYFDKYINVATCRPPLPPKKKNSGFAPTSRAFHCAIEQWKKVVLQGVALKICSPCPPLLPI